MLLRRYKNLLNESETVKEVSKEPKGPKKKETKSKGAE